MSHPTSQAGAYKVLPTVPKTVLLIIAGSLLMTLAAKVQVPFYPVPMSMQTLVAIGLGLSAGPVVGVAAILLYLGQGLVGLPVFSGSGAGPAYMMGPTGGYLVGFVLAAFVAGTLAQAGYARTAVRAGFCALLAGALVYLPGLVWLGQFTGYGTTLLVAGLFPFLAGDVIKAIIAGLISAGLNASSRNNLTHKSHETLKK
ncbi:hypothetical protein CBW24_16110 (plasmid) [Pacificitalea manganoxidans]|jgi:biotin transport system substrate-specific component|uniref:Biotin transporter n=1 Tax=Pacificitalea manganoxidans TaxID=1411902 RepID=A0A291M448_9RHOB|nr:biotin transporter BioY [Pacificitalea manganoxidans]ATI43680.1 hypothetical protein CBW24_16110 [Pacificitalea manganoxidans]MDR6310074.1 biotin transport system substrate-specific component [Pacificitalea manganoxidans]